MNSSFNEYLLRIQQVDEIARKTINQRQQQMPDKYSNIQASIKLLNNLVCNLKRKAELYQFQLKGRAKINDLKEQIEFHKTRVTECETLTKKLSEKINKKRQNIDVQEQKVKALGEKLLFIKTENIKKILRIEELEMIDERKQQLFMRETKKKAWKLTTQSNQSFYKPSSIDTQAMNLQALKRQKEQLVQRIYEILDRNISLNHTIEESFLMMKNKLSKYQRKANSNGMNGSLMFKMIENEKLSFKKPLLDPKLIIYDVLKTRHKKHVHQEKLLKKKPVISLEQFLQYTPLQIFGIIELNGGLGILKNSINEFQKQNCENASKTSSLANTINS